MVHFCDRHCAEFASASAFDVVVKTLVGTKTEVKTMRRIPQEVMARPLNPFPLQVFERQGISFSNFLPVLALLDLPQIGEVVVLLESVSFFG